MILQYVNADLLNSFQHYDLDGIVHGCNCFHTMGAGIAGAIAKEFPVALEADKKKTICGDWDKIGTYSIADTAYGKIINAYTQYTPGRAPKTNLYSAIEKVFTKLNSDFSGKILGIPKIGSGIAGGNWDEIVEIINNVTPDLKLIIFYI